MAGRSPSPSLSCLASAPSMKQSPRRPRPRLLRGVSSCSAALSDDSLTATLKSLTTDEAKDVFAVLAHASPRASPSPSGLSVESPGLHGAASPTRPTYLDETPGRRKSKPIAIQPPRHARPVYTPLSARGDLPGGYFPNHETLPRQYKPHPFSKPESTPSSPAMSSASSPVSTPAISTPRIPPSAPLAAYSPELTLPIGKYHPSNYKLVSPTSTPPTSTSPTSTPPTNRTPPTNLEIPSEGKKSRRPSHDRRPSEVRRKVQQYQRDMLAQARRAGLPNSVQGSAKSAKPISPRLLPLGSPGPITPLELEESAGYLVAGAREGLVGGGSEREREMVGRMIRSEQERDLTQGTQTSSVKV